MGFSPDHKVPEGSANTGGSTAAGLAEFSTKTEEQWRESSTRSPFKDSFNPIGAIFQGLLMALQGIATGIFGFLDEIADLFELRWDQVDNQGSDIRDLQDKTTDLSLATGHATAYMPTSPGTTTSPERMPFTAQSGTTRGVTNLGNGQWRLESGGEWDLSAQVEFWGGALMPPETFLEIIVLYPSPNNGIFDGIQAKASTTANVTVTNVTSTVVPGPGYRVEVRAWTGKFPVLGGSFRGISGGYKTTRLRIRKFEMLKDE